MMVSPQKILFVCVENACRSQMAQGFCNALAKHVVTESAGTQPAEKVDDRAVRVMAEVGIDISGQQPTALTGEMNNRFDVIVTMGCIDGCPITPKEKTMVWDIEDPRGKSIEVYRAVRDDIRRYGERLVEEIV